MDRYQVIERVWKSSEKQWQFIRVVSTHKTERIANRALLQEIPKARLGRDLAVVPREPEQEGESFA